MAKLIPLKIKRNDLGFGQWDVLDQDGTLLGEFPSRAAAAEFVLTARRDENGAYEPDYEWLAESRGGDPDAAFLRAENRYEAWLDQIGSY